MIEIEDPKFNVELGKMLAETGDRLQEQGARAQCCAAFAMLQLMGQVDLSAFPAERKAEVLSYIFKCSAYTLAGAPSVLRALQLARPGLDKPGAIAAIARMFGLLFVVDPEPLIEVMLGVPAAAGAEAGPAGGVPTRDLQASMASMASTTRAFREASSSMHSGGCARDGISNIPGDGQ